MNAEKYLERLKKIDFIIPNKIAEYKRLVSMAEGMGDFSVQDKVQSSPNLQKIAGAIGKYIDIEREIEALELERAAIIATLEKLPAVEYRLLYELYAKDRTLKECAFDLKMPYDTVKKKKRSALRLLQAILDGR